MFAYCILRAVESKLGGVILMLMAVGVLAVFGCVRVRCSGSLVVYGINKILIMVWVVSFVMLVYLGGLGVEYPYRGLSVVFTLAYFTCILILSLVGWLL